VVAGIADERWSVAEMIERTASFSPAPTGPKGKRDSFMDLWNRMPDGLGTGFHRLCGGVLPLLQLKHEGFAGLLRRRRASAPQHWRRSFFGRWHVARDIESRRLMVTLKANHKAPYKLVIAGNLDLNPNRRGVVMLQVTLLFQRK
jgi:hypothetical protein